MTKYRTAATIRKLMTAANDGIEVEELLGITAE